MVKNLAIFIFFILLSIGGRAQMMGIRKYKMDGNSSDIRILTILKKSNGYIYLGTSGGLYKFDGIKFIPLPFRTAATNPSVTSIFEDRSKQLWVGMENGDIGTVINEQVNFYNPEEGTPKKMITSFLQDKQNNMWFSTNGEGVYFINNHHIYNVGIDNGLPDKYAHAMALADNGDIIIGTDQGLSIVSPKGAKKSILNLSSRNGLPDNLVKVIKPAGNNKFYIGMQDGGICIYDHNNNTFEIDRSLQKMHAQVNDILVTTDKIWIATEDKGLLRLSGLSGEIFNIDIDPKNLNLNNIIQDNEGNFWLLSNNSELIKTSGDQLTLVAKYNNGEFAKVHAILYDHHSDILQATPSGLICYKENDHSINKIFKIKELDEKCSITALYQDQNQNIWIGTMGKGLFLLDENSGKYRKVIENQSLSNGSVLSITGKGNEVFISTLEGAVQFHLSEDHNIYKTMTNSGYRGLESIGTNYIYDIFKDSKERIWFASDGKYISALQNGKFTNYNESNGIKDKVIYSVTEDIKGNIWFSTHSDGIYKFDGTSFKNYSVKDGLSDIDISSVKADLKGNILIVYKNGIDILDPSTGQISYINAAQGIKEINVQDLATVSQDSSGAILVSTTDGIVRYLPLPYVKHQPKTILENVQMFLNEIPKETLHNFSYNENSFSFSFTGLYYTDPEAIQYKYILEGYENHWRTTKDRLIQFPKLPAGKYRFRVRSSINQVFNDDDEASYEFVIAKPFWTRWWFVLLSFLLISGLLYWFIKLRERNVKKVGQLEQEKIKFQFETLRNQVNPHFLFNSFNTLITIIEDDPQTAVEYVEQLSDFFRNIVTYRDKDVITLKEEMRLLKTYLFIQKKRFGDNLKLAIELSNDEQELNFIPPLTLQLLAENAIKHNAVSKETPLTIRINSDNNYIVIANNINPRMSLAEGAGMGLQNIVNRYNLLSKKHVIIANDNNTFKVSLPILKKII